MNKKAFILSGAFLISLAALCTALHAYLLLSKITSGEMTGYLQLFLQLATLFIFGLLIWKRLDFMDKSHRFKVWFLAAFLAAFFMSLMMLPQLLFTYVEINPARALTDEIADWSNSGAKGDFSFSTYGKIKVAIYSAILSLATNWPLCAALYYCSRGPRNPRDENRLSQPLIKATYK